MLTKTRQQQEHSNTTERVDIDQRVALALPLHEDEDDTVKRVRGETETIQRSESTNSDREDRYSHQSIRRFGRVQATTMWTMLLSIFVASVIYIEVDTGPSSLTSTIIVKRNSTVQGVLGSPFDEQEVSLTEESDTSMELNTREDMIRMIRANEEEARLRRREDGRRRESLARNRQASAEAQEERQKEIEEKRKVMEEKRLQVLQRQEEDKIRQDEETIRRKERLAEGRKARIDAREERMIADQSSGKEHHILQGDEATSSQDQDQETIKVAEDTQLRHVRRKAKLYTFAFR